MTDFVQDNRKAKQGRWRRRRRRRRKQMAANELDGGGQVHLCRFGGGQVHDDLVEARYIW